MVKGYEFEKGKFVLFTADELKALAAGSRQTIDIVSFIPERSVDPIYYDKAYLLAPGGRGERPYALLMEAMRRSGRCALAKWAWRAKEYVVQIRPAEGGLVLQQLFYAEEVRQPASLGIDLVDVGEAELQLAMKLIEQIAEEGYEPAHFVDEEKQRLLAAIAAKVAGRAVEAPAAAPTGGQVIDLMAALRASLASSRPAKEETPAPAADVPAAPARASRERKPVRRAASAPAVPAPAAKRPAAKTARR